MSSKPSPESDSGTVTLTRPSTLAGCGVLGLILGWSVRPVSLRFGLVEPRVSWLMIGLLFFFAVVMGSSAVATRRTVTGARPNLSPERAVNRLVMGKSCALVGAILLGAFSGYAIAQLGVDDPASLTRLWRSLLAALGGGLIMLAALLLERACRVPSEPS